MVENILLKTHNFFEKKWSKQRHGFEPHCSQSGNQYVGKSSLWTPSTHEGTPKFTQIQIYYIIYENKSTLPQIVIKKNP